MYIAICDTSSVPSRPNEPKILNLLVIYLSISLVRILLIYFQVFLRLSGIFSYYQFLISSKFVRLSIFTTFSFSKILGYSYVNI